MEDAQALEFCHVTVLDGGAAITATYRWAGNDVDGSDTWSDEDYSDWSDDDIRGLVADMIGCTDDDVDLIEVNWE